MPTSPVSAVRTPDERFAHLPGFPYAPHSLEDLEGYPGLRMHYVDEGPRAAGETFLCLHGNPSWSYLYRKMIPIFLATGARVLAPDLFGFGRSDKPLRVEDYSFDFHRDSVMAFIRRLDLRDITLVCQDWGGGVGLTVPMEMPERFKRLLVMNTMFATGDAPLSPGFLAWREWVKNSPDVAVGKLMKRSHPALTPEEVAAYDAPFPDLRYKAGIISFPPMVCDRPDAPGAETCRRARDWWRTQWRGQSFMAVGMKDPVFTYEHMDAMRQHIAGCPPALKVADGGHFVQECGEEIARAALASWGAA